MASPASKDALLAELDRVVRETLAYFEGAGRVTAARVDRWHARDVLMHFIYFHDATAWGFQSAALGGPPWPLPTDADGINEVCRRLREHESFGRAVQNAPDIDKPCFRRTTGEFVTGRQRLEVLARHWAEHVRELQTAARA